jgi:hypothetical protein
MASNSQRISIFPLQVATATRMWGPKSQRCQWHSGVNDSAVHVTAVSMTQRCQWLRCAYHSSVNDSPVHACYIRRNSDQQQYRYRQASTVPKTKTVCLLLKRKKNIIILRPSYSFGVFFWSCFYLPAHLVHRQQPRPALRDGDESDLPAQMGPPRIFIILEGSVADPGCHTHTARKK